MEVYLNHIDGIADAICSLYISKRHLTRIDDEKIRRIVRDGTNESGWIKQNFSDEYTSDLYMFTHYFNKLLKYGSRHITLLRFIDLSFTVYDIHRGGQDDIDSHAQRMNNRIIRSSTRLADYGRDEMSEYYQRKIISTDTALSYLGIELADTIDVKGNTYRRTVNGYVLDGLENNRDVKRGLYMLSIPSTFIFKIQLPEFAHVYKMRKKGGGANPEVSDAVEKMADCLEKATLGLIDRKYIEALPI